MQTHLAPEFQGTPDGEEAEAILRRCVHCGFCTATCPTYQLLGDELDGPRGRIYLIKQVLEGHEPTRKTQEHLDRCLTCRNCETTCPSGVAYGQLVDIGRRVVDAKVERPAAEKAVRWALRKGMTSPAFGTAIRIGQAVRPLLPASVKNKVPQRTSADQLARAHRWPTRQHARKVLMLLGCVQPTLAPNINSATARVLDACGIQTVVSDEAGCCGAVRLHLNDREGGLADMRRNIDAWWPQVEGLGGVVPVEAIIFNATGCGVTVKEYGHALAHDPDYAEKARRVSEVARDVSELLPQLVKTLKQRLPHPPSDGRPRARLAYHPPCTLQHGQQLRGGVEAALTELGFEVHLAAQESHLCCGSAGTYSVLQPTLAYQLRDRKVGHLQACQPQSIVSGNVGCIQHLQSGTDVPVQHWIEALDDALGG
ncbi:glycolate oxidase iron-sulfur subunit [Sphaerotilus hippei]|uniref:Glycolate oxidase iron-sulfur subunit n=1 Tax=Sphaerotilus hippei TaxID=744406 RepID=A0A318GWY8_9BURK|nr:glycolate oxidase subunit GlcF [Sphaerotilus hippei]PXW93652.1 glycolate oxidase iron-sulfur subunit [Sphaerotilus hippei]